MIVSLKAINQVWCKLDATPEIREKVKQACSFDVPGAEWTSQMKNGFWDGRVSLFDTKRSLFPIGLLPNLEKFCSEEKIDFDCNLDALVSISDDSIEGLLALADTLPPRVDGKTLPRHPHQTDALLEACSRLRGVLEIPPGGGKSWVVYILIRWLQLQIPPEAKILLVVPGIGLANQIFSDFLEYSEDSGWAVKDHVHKIMGGEEKWSEKQIHICVRNSAMDQEQDWYDQYHGVIFDECHLVKAESVQSIASNLVNAWFRIGTTATLDKVELNRFKIISVLGPSIKLVSTKELMDQNLLSDMEIEILELKHHPELVQKVKRRTFVDEYQLVYTDPLRNDFLVNLVKMSSGNTMVLFNFVDLHGWPLYERICTDLPDRKVYYISGKISGPEREKIRKEFNKQKNAVLVANYQTVGVGINIPNIHNIIFASGSKSIIRVLQAIGRGLRMSKNKSMLKLYDVVDNLCWKSYKNHLFKHGVHRKQIYREERFKFSTTKIDLGA